MKLKYAKILSLSIIALLATSPAFSMLILKQEKKKSAACYALKKKMEEDSRIPHKQDRNGFEDIVISGGQFIVTHGREVVAASHVAAAATVAVLNYLNVAITGKPLFYDRQIPKLEKLCKHKSDYSNLTQEERKEIKNFPRGYDEKPAYKVEPDNSERGYRFIPDHSKIDPYNPKNYNEPAVINFKEYSELTKKFNPQTVINPEKNKLTECFPEPKKEIPFTDCFPETEKNELTIPGCFNDQEIEIPSTECFPDTKENEAIIPKGCFIEQEKSELYNYMRAPWQPTEKDRFFPDKKWDGKTRRHPITGQIGFPDRKGNIWVPTGEKPSRSHGKPHWDVIDKHGNHTNVLPGGIVRETGKLFNPYQALLPEGLTSLPAEILLPTSKVSGEGNFPDDFINKENILKGFQNLKEYNRFQEKLSKIYGTDFKNIPFLPFSPFWILHSRFVIPKSRIPNVTITSEDDITSTPIESFKTDNLSSRENIITNSVLAENLQNFKVEAVKIQTESTINSAPMENSKADSLVLKQLAQEILSQPVTIANNNVAKPESFVNDIKEALYISKDEIKEAAGTAIGNVITQKICNVIDNRDKDTRLNNKHIISENKEKLASNLKQIEELKKIVNMSKSSDEICKSQEEICNIAQEVKKLQDVIKEKEQEERSNYALKQVTYAFAGAFVEFCVERAIKSFFGWPF